jgi:hypothetical protein
MKSIWVSVYSKLIFEFDPCLVTDDIGLFCTTRIYNRRGICVQAPSLIGVKKLLVYVKLNK